MFKSKIMLFLIPFLLIVGISIGLLIQEQINENHLTKEAEKFNEILNLTKNYYYEDVNSDELFQDAVNGMLSKLDPHSIYIPTIEQKGIDEQFRGRFEGIGIEFQIINDTITVVSPISGGPSQSVGIEPGDRIIKIDGKSSIGYTNSDVLKKLRGAKGTSVKIKVYRPLVNKKIDFTIIRDEIPIYTVDASIMISDSIGYISLSKFSETSSIEMKSALSDLTKSGMKKLILDLRNNPGGYLKRAFEIADMFIDGHKMIVYTRGRRSELDDDLVAERDYPYEKIPLVILVNRGSASASEIVSGAVQDWDRGLLVGETTFGKGLVQRPFLLPDSSAVRITIAKYYTPSGRQIQRHFENKEDYYEEVQTREEKDTVNINHTLEVDSTKKVFHTAGGRPVVGGGGITPDFIVENKELTDYSIKLRSNGIFYKFIRRYLDSKSSERLKNYLNNFNKFKLQFKLNDRELKSFIKFAERNKVKYNEKEYFEDQDYIKTRLKAEIAKNFWKNNGLYSVLLKLDKQFLKAKQLLKENFKLNPISK